MIYAFNMCIKSLKSFEKNPGFPILEYLSDLNSWYPTPHHIISALTPPVSQPTAGT